MFTLLISRLHGALQFKELTQKDKLGSNIVTQEPNPLNDRPKEGDNAICSSDTVIGMVDGESVDYKGSQIPPKYISYYVSRAVFRSNADLFEKTAPVEDSNDIMKKMEGAFKLGVQNGVDRYRKVLAGHTVATFDSLLSKLGKSEIPKQFQDIYDKDKNWAGVVDMLMTTAGYALVPQTGRFKETIDQIRDINAKLNSGVSIIGARVTQDMEPSKKDAEKRAKKKAKDPSKYFGESASVQGLQYGRSAVLVFGRKKTQELKNAAKEKVKRFIYTIKHYSISYEEDLYRVYHDLANGKPLTIESFRKFDFPCEESDIVVVTDATMIENMASTFIELLVNFGLHKLQHNKDWAPAGDQDLINLVNQYILKMSRPETIQYVRGKIGGKTFGPSDWEPKDKGIASCPLKAYYPYIYTGLGSGVINRFFGDSDCLTEFAKKNYIFESKHVRQDSINDPLVNSWSTAAITKMFGLVTSMIQKSFNEVLPEGYKPTAFINRGLITRWLKEHQKKRKGQPHKFPTQEELADSLLRGGVSDPVQGDLSLFVNILVRNPEPKSDLLCLSMDDKDGNRLGTMIQNFFSKTAYQNVIDELKVKLDQMKAQNLVI